MDASSPSGCGRRALPEVDKSVRSQSMYASRSILADLGRVKPIPWITRAFYALFACGETSDDPPDHDARNTPSRIATRRSQLFIVHVLCNTVLFEGVFGRRGAERWQPRPRVVLCPVQLVRAGLSALPFFPHSLSSGWLLLPFFAGCCVLARGVGVITLTLGATFLSFRC